MKAGRKITSVHATGGLGYDPRHIVEGLSPIKDAFTVLKEAGLEGAEMHLLRAMMRLDSGDCAGSVRESVHLVESVARQLDPTASTTLGPALKALEQHIKLHPALRAGFNSIYGYASDEQGIRHALLDDVTNVDRHDAAFMFGACASFATYLVRKAKKAGLMKG